MTTTRNNSRIVGKPEAIWFRRRDYSGEVGFSPAIGRSLLKRFVGTNPTEQSITSGLPSSIQDPCLPRRAAALWEETRFSKGGTGKAEDSPSAQSFEYFL